MLVALATACSDDGLPADDLGPPPAYQEEFPFLAATPYPAQHMDPRASDYIADTMPARLEELWSTLEDTAIVQPCSVGYDGVIFCTAGWDPADGDCNLIALDGTTGQELWRDRDPQGDCILDAAATLSNPLVDVDGHVYSADTQRVAAFDADGTLLWENPYPSTIVSANGYPNPPFGVNMLPTGELVTVTMGDAHVLVIDRATGMTLDVLDLQSEKTDTSGPMPPTYMEGLLSLEAREMWWKVSVGDSGYESDNNVAVRTQTRGANQLSTIVISGGAPVGDMAHQGAVWAVDYDPTQVMGSRLSVAFHVPFVGDGGIATTPSISKDGRWVVIGDNDSHIGAIDLETCLATASGGACDQVGLSQNVGFEILASLAITPDNRVLTNTGGGVDAYQVSGGGGSPILVERAWQGGAGGLGAVVSVITASENYAFYNRMDLATGDFAMEIIRMSDGSFVAAYPGRDAANFGMLIDPDTQTRVVIVNMANLAQETARTRFPALVSWPSTPAGVMAWAPR